MYRQLLEIVPDALLVVDDAGRISQANAHAARLFGVAPGDLVGRAIETLMPAGVRERHRQHRARYMGDPHVRPMGGTGQSLVGLRADGVEFPVEIALSPIDTEGGLRYLASIRDISETQRARQAIVRSRYDAVMAGFGQRALESDTTSGVLDQAPAVLADALGIGTVLLGFVGTDRDGVRVQAAVGSDGRETALAALLNPEESPLRDVLDRGQPAVVQALPESDDAPSPRALMMPLFDRRGTMGVLVCLADSPDAFDHDALHLVQSFATMISAFVQRRRTEEQLAHSQRLDAIGQLTGGIAHDFNNLLTVLSGALQMLEAEHPGNADAQDLIATAVRSADRGAELTAKLLAFARRQSLVPQAIDVTALLRDVQRMLNRTLGDAIELRLDCSADLRAAFVDPAQLDAALVNLALNARDAMPRGGDIDIDISAKNVELRGGIDEELPPGAYVRILVADTGMGMSPDTLAHAMEPFYTTKPSGRGTGLGLSMVYGFARQSGGQLRITSSLGYGTQVALYLPAADMASTAQGTAAPLQSAAGAGEVLLVVEDDPDVARVAVTFLSRLGYDVLLAVSADEALVLLRERGDIGLLFSDVRLGAGLNGRELADVAKQQRPRLPVLLTSGFEDELPAATSTSPPPLLRKPYRLDVLGSTVRRMLDAR